MYGYANGDPVNFSDPYGLMACDPTCAGQGALIGGALGTLAGVAVSGMCSMATVGLCAAVSPGIVVSTTGLGVGLGGLAGAFGQQGVEMASSALDRLMKWTRRKAGQIGLVIGQTLAGPDADTKWAEERLRQQEAQEQLDEEQIPNPGAGGPGGRGGG